jgi:phosphoketolase
VVRLLDAGDIPSEHLPDSKHRVVRLVDVLKFQARRERRREGRRRIVDAVHDADLPY